MRETFGASILAVGTELTTGQIVNRNAAWISERLVNLGLEITLHEAVADDRSRILEALNHCASVSKFIFVTGGLGPTTDDFTREVVANWLQSPLEFHPSIWEKIVARLTQLGIPIAESNRQQCFFPKDAVVLPNPAGTAAGFTARTHHQKQIWIFPGPPHEVRAVWEQGVEKQLLRILPGLQPLQLFTWQCIGKSEAELGEITEKALFGSGLKTGYRAHRPFVEIKVWCTRQEEEEKRAWLHKLDETLAPWILGRQGTDFAEKLLLFLEQSDSIEILDSATGGILLERLGTLLRKPRFQKQADEITFTTEWTKPSDPQEWTKSALENADETTTTLVLAGFSSDGRGTVGFREGSRIFQETIQTPYVPSEWPDRMRHYLTEIALKRWCEWMDRTTS